ncbi:hypothetical protein ACA910_020198 [Epithemia clementina (nom. ined.)]
MANNSKSGLPNITTPVSSSLSSSKMKNEGLQKRKGSPKISNNNNTSCVNYRCSMCWSVGFALVASVILAAYYHQLEDSEVHALFGISGRERIKRIDDGIPLPSYVTLPSELVGLSYHVKDFSNDAGVVPTFWNCSRVSGDCNNNTRSIKHTWGPCYSTIRRVHWQSTFYERNNGGKHNEYYTTTKLTRTSTDDDVRGLCRPGFVILGAGKCGTSSLYHYLVDHPRVLPAQEKQIHYFKYYARRSMNWYLSHFPTAVAFLSSGALMTGEASPGYLPYPDVAPLLARRMPGSRLIVVGRDPIDRMYSSFVYSYIDPAIEAFRRNAVHGVPDNLTDEEYKEKYLFTFEETIRAELKVLRKCLAEPDGAAIVKARLRYQSTSWGAKVYEDRERLGLAPLADIDSFCYGSKVNETVLRPQWAQMVAQHPQKVIIDKNTHLLQSHLGRSIYVFPLEWWYAHFDANDIFFMCTEDMKDLSGNSMEPLRKWLGLPVFNFSQTLQKGVYNVGGHRGYDKELSWDKITAANASGGFAPTRVIPLSADFREEVETFLKPFNERLFQLVGKRCQW